MSASRRDRLKDTVLEWHALGEDPHSIATMAGTTARAVGVWLKLWGKKPHRVGNAALRRRMSAAQQLHKEGATPVELSERFARELPTIHRWLRGETH